MATAHSIVTGQPHPLTLPSSSELFTQQPFHSANLPLDARVPEKIKANIWNEEFVDLGALVRGNTEHSMLCSFKKTPTSLLFEWLCAD